MTDKAKQNLITAEQEIQQVKVTLNWLRQSMELISQKILTLEQAQVIINKTLTAVLKELVSTNTLDDKKVMERIMQDEDEREKQRVQQLLAQNIITASPEINASSLVIVSQTIIDTSTKQSHILGNYLAVDLSLSNYEKQREYFVGRKVGDIVEIPLPEEQKIVNKVLEIYNLIERQVNGEAAAAQNTQEVTKTDK